MGSTNISNHELAEVLDAPPPPALPVQTGWKSLDGLTKAAIITCTLMVVAFIAPPVGFVFALASIGLSAGALIVARRDGRRNGAAFNTLMVSLVATVMLAVGSFLLLDSAPKVVVSGEAIAIPVGAPQADVFVTVQAIDTSGERETKAIKDALDSKQIDGTVVHVANATSVFGSTEIYRWESLQALQADGQPDQLSCIGQMSSWSTSAHSCGGWENVSEGGAGSAAISWGERVAGDNASYDVLVWNAPSEGVWMTVETKNGSRIVSNVAGGVGFVEYDAKYSKASMVSIFNADYELIWHQIIN